MFKGRINLFNEKTIYDVYNFEFNLHTRFDKNVCRGILISKEKTLGPRIVYSYKKISNIIPEGFDIVEYIKGRMEKEFIHHLNKNVGLECFMRKKDIPAKIYNDFKEGVR